MKIRVSVVTLMHRCYSGSVYVNHDVLFIFFLFQINSSLAVTCMVFPLLHLWLCQY